MKILMVSKLSPFAGGGLERVVKDLLSVICDNLKAAVTVIYMTYSREKRVKLRVGRSSVNLIPILVPKVKVLDVLIYNILAVLRVFRERYDIVHTHGECGAGYAILAQFLPRRNRHIHTYHGTWYLNLLNRRNNEKLLRPLMLVAVVILSWLEIIAGKKSAVVTVVSDRVKLEVTKYYKIDSEKIMTIQNGVDTNLFRPRDKNNSRKSLGLDDGFHYGLFVGGDLDRKGFGSACEVFRAVCSKEEYKLIVLGISKDRIVKFLGCYPDFVYSPQSRLSDQQVAWAYNASDFLLFLSTYEGFSLTLLEALSSGIPVIMLEQMAKNHSLNQGIVVCKDEEEVTKAILGLQDQELYKRLSRSAKRVGKEFSAKVLYRAYTEVYSSLALRKTNLNDNRFRRKGASV